MPAGGLGIQVEIIGGGSVTYNTKPMKDALRAAGNAVAKDARALIRSKIGGGRAYSRMVTKKKTGATSRKRYQGSQPGNPPDSVTGLLARSIKVKLWKAGDGVSVRDTAFYSLFLEDGASGGVSSFQTGVKGKRNAYHRAGRAWVKDANVGRRVLKPRPFLSVAMGRDKPTIDKLLKRAADDALGWAGK